MKYYLENIEEVLQSLQTDKNGLSEAEAEKRLKENGRNRLEAAKGKSLLQRFIDQIMDPMILVLLAAAAVSGVLAFVQNDSFVDVFIILAVVIVNAVLGVYQESKAEKAIEALQEMSAATSKVLRDGKIRVIPSEEIVKGDVILLEAGDAVPADARLIESASLKAEESALTGESVPVNKFIDILNLKDSEEDVILGDRSNMVYMGSDIVYGRGTAVVTETGMGTEMGKIADAIANASEGETPLQKRLDQLSKILTKLVLVISVIIFAVQIIRASSLNMQVILDSFMIAVSLAVAAIPEGLAAVVTVVLSIGVTNIAKRNAIIRKLTAVETLGCAEIICSDKTGTLTQNKMTVVDERTDDRNLLTIGMALCSDAELNEDGSVTGEPTEAALVSFASKNDLNKNNLKKEYPRIGEAPFDSMRKMMSTVHNHDGEIIQFTKGALDVLLGRCTLILKDGETRPITEEDKENILKENKEMADKALRVLALACRRYDAIPQTYESNVLEQNLTYVGIMGMIDPVRPEVKDAIEKCRHAGIRPIMITGDHIDTASAIAKELGILRDGDKAMTGAELNAISDEEFEKIYKNVSVYARVQPEHKTRIVKAWQKEGHITAMTGDGVNDAPSIKTADIGTGMGITGTDVTKNVADMVLADDNFATIVSAVEEGRRIYDNIRKAIQFLLASNMSEVLSIFTATLMGFTILKPVHLLFINLVTDCFPALALGMEEAEPGIMEKKPRNAKAGIFAEGMGFDIAYQGIAVTVLILLSYFLGVKMETGSFQIIDNNYGTTMAFLTMCFAEIFHSLNMRSLHQSIFSLKKQNKVLLIAALVSLLTASLVCEIPFLANAFEFVNVSFKEYIIAALLGFMIIPIVECVKAIERKKR